ncbi:TetR/AcrR family transcriptional regulator [Microvirga sp. W0021]|uniref:TetR/AcrR family transcriptional regulator n=1 Tax=Hohaiivirga grylli TaxID=3133970 RepID=A0ABV0BKN2_9HYPH
MSNEPVAVPDELPAMQADIYSHLAVDARLLAIASDRLRTGGRHSVTVVSVAEAAGMTHANVYRYFQSKSALIDAIAAQWLKGLEATIASIADGPDPVDDKLENLLSIVAHAQRDLMVENRNLFEVYADAAAGSRVIYRRFRARLKQLVVRVLDEGMASSVFEIRDRENAATFITDTASRFIHPVAIRMDSQMPREMFDRRLDVIIHVILRALRSNYI